MFPPFIKTLKSVFAILKAPQSENHPPTRALLALGPIILPSIPFLGPKLMENNPPKYFLGQT